MISTLKALKYSRFFLISRYFYFFSRPYITLLCRAPGYDENIRLHLKLLPNAGVRAGNLLNLILYVPLGWTMRKAGKKAIVIGLILSVFCELMQYATGRGRADVNDVMFNATGAAVGVWVAKKLRKM